MSLIVAYFDFNLVLQPPLMHVFMDQQTGDQQIGIAGPWAYMNNRVVLILSSGSPKLSRFINCRLEQRFRAMESLPASIRSVPIAKGVAWTTFLPLMVHLIVLFSRDKHLASKNWKRMESCPGRKAWLFDSSDALGSRQRNSANATARQTGKSRSDWR